MDSDEDEDVIFEGSQLHNYITTSDYSGPEINYYESGKTTFLSPPTASTTESKNSFKALLLSWFSRLEFRQENHEERFAQEILLSVMDTALISFEDADFLSNILGDKLTHTMPSKGLDTGFEFVTIGGVVLSFTLLSTSRLPLVLRVPSLLCVGVNVLQTIRMKCNDWTRMKYNQLVEKFQVCLTLLHDLCSIMNKSLQFVQEMELIDRGFTLPNLITHLSMKTLPNQPSALLCLPLRQELMEVINELHDFMRCITLQIRESLPLNSAIDNASHYVACAEQQVRQSSDNQLVTLQTIRAAMRQCHLQLSEMLRRLVLSFLVPYSQRHYDVIAELSRNLPGRITPLTHRLRMAYDYYTAWKVSDPSDIPCCTDVVSDGIADRPKGLDLALHSLERHLRATALLIDSVRETELVPGMRTQLGHECKAVATCWELVEMELDKLSNPSSSSTDSAVPKRPTVEPNRSAGDAEALPLYGAWEPDVQDLEILEADLAKWDAIQKDVVDVDDDDMLLLRRETREERLARKRELAAQSKRLYSELQVVLKSKAAEWKEREARVMERLGKPVEPEEDDPVTTSVANGDEEDNDRTLEKKKKKILEVDDEEEKQQEKEEEDEEANHPERLSMRFDATRIVPSSTFGIQASLAAQVRALASQRAVQNEDVIGSDSDDAECSTGEDS